MYLVCIYIAIFAVFTALHLYGSCIKKDSLRAPTKPVILLAILGMYLEYARFTGAEPSAPLVFALLTSWLGDVLLIPKGVRWFTAGGTVFWTSHFLFIWAFISSGISFSTISPVIIVLIALVFIAAVCFIFSRLRRCLPKALFYPMFLYLLTNAAMNVFAWFRLLSGSCSPASGLITAIGALLFFLSDSSLFFVRFDKNSPFKSHFPVMLTYSMGEFMIILGFMLSMA